tara:strand:+ start:225 stop:452 length:228 start_codon:yes stop_codon:yes gene_type:complete
MAKTLFGVDLGPAWGRREDQKCEEHGKSGGRERTERERASNGRRDLATEGTAWGRKTGTAAGEAEERKESEMKRT